MKSQAPKTQLNRRLLAPAAATAAAILAVVLAPDLWSLVSSYVWHLIPMSLYDFLPRTKRLWFLAFAAIVLSHRRFPAKWLDVLESWSDRALARPASLVLGSLCVAGFATWFPSYLTWPWWADVEHFAVLAHSWDRGVLPYRDLRDFNFPMPIYVFWTLGKLFGWDSTAAYYAYDALLLVGFAVAIAYWSVAVFGKALPGLVAVTCILGNYFGLPYQLVAQRDWHAPAWATCALMLLQARKDATARLAAAALYAASLATRPHVVVFGPAFAVVLFEHVRGSERLARDYALLLLKWGATLAAAVALCFSPLAAAGILDDFIRSFGQAWYGGAYHKTDGDAKLTGFLGQFQDHVKTLILLSTTLLAIRPGSRGGIVARTWAVALVGVYFYRPLSPVAHGYLSQPLTILSLICLAVISDAILSTERLPRVIRLAALGVFIVQEVPKVPVQCGIVETFAALESLGRGVPRMDPPIGCRHYLNDLNYAGSDSTKVGWRDYQRTLQYLKATTDEETLIANCLRRNPYPTLNGPCGRLTPFPSSAGLLWIRWVDPKLEKEFAEELIKPRKTKVVWVPSATDFEGPMRLPFVEETIRKHYRLEIRFGPIEIWRRRGALIRTDKPTRSDAAERREDSP